MADETLIREGRHLRDWLPELLGPDAPTRRRAENAISAILWGVPVADATAYLHFPSDIHHHSAAVGREIERIFADESFDGTAFVRSAIEVMQADAAAASARYELQNQLSELEAIDFVESGDYPTDEQLEARVPGYAELTQQIGEATRAEREGMLPNSHGTYTLHLVLEHAGPALLRMPELVRRKLSRRDHVATPRIAKALENLGPVAGDFLHDLFNAISVTTHSRSESFAFPDALAAVGREHPETIRRLGEIVYRNATDDLAYSALYVLGRIGTDAVRQVPSLVDDLFSAADDTARGRAILHTLAPLASHRRDLFERILELARAGPPDMQAPPGYPQYPSDVTMWRRGSALESLGEFRAFAPEAVAVLVDALDSFEEYDPDWGYENGSYGRVLHSLQRLIPEAAAAVPVLLNRLRSETGEVEWRAIQFLGDLGPAAREALPALRQLQAELETDEPTPPSSEPPSRLTEPLEWAILQISRTQEN